METLRKTADHLRINDGVAPSPAAAGKVYRGAPPPPPPPLPASPTSSAPSSHGWGFPKPSTSDAWLAFSL